MGLIKKFYNPYVKKKKFLPKFGILDKYKAEKSQKNCRKILYISFICPQNNKRLWKKETDVRTRGLGRKSLFNDSNLLYPNKEIKKIPFIVST